MAADPATRVHLDWLSYIQPVGLVVSPPALTAAQCVLPLDLISRQMRLLPPLHSRGELGD